MQQSGDPDKDILAVINDPDGKEKGFKLLVERYQERLYWQVRKMVFSHQDADDILQEVFIKVFKNLDNFKKEAKLYTWLYRITSNETISFIKRDQKLRLSKMSYDPGLTSTSSSDPGSDEILSVLRSAIEKLPEKQKEIFVMRYFQELKYEEMSEILDTSVGALKASYHHAVKKVEYSIKNYER